MARRFQLRITASAYRDISAIWEWTVKHFGHNAALRYEALIDQAILDITDDPKRPGVKLRADLQSGIWLYHLDFSRDHVGEDFFVRSPRHFVAFMHIGPDILEIVRILHDSRDLARHLSEPL